MYISKFSTEDWQGNQNKIAVNLAQNWTDIETAIKELDAHHKTLVTLETNDEAHMSIGGGLGKYIRDVQLRNSKKNSQPKVLENRTNAISGENYVFYGIFYHCGIL